MNLPQLHSQFQNCQNMLTLCLQIILLIQRMSNGNQDMMENMEFLFLKEKMNLSYRIVHILLFNEKGEMALQMRSSHKKFCPNHLSTAVGGHVQTGETYEQA